MDIETYFRSKGRFPGLTKAEALVLGIPFPPKSGWLSRHGSHEINVDQEQMLARLALHRRTRMPATSTKSDISQLSLFERTCDER